MANLWRWRRRLHSTEFLRDRAKTKPALGKPNLHVCHSQYKGEWKHGYSTNTGIMAGGRTCCWQPNPVSTLEFPVLPHHKPTISLCYNALAVLLLLSHGVYWVLNKRAWALGVAHGAPVPTLRWGSQARRATAPEQQALMSGAPMFSITP